MLIPPGVRIFIASQPVDLRASFYRLASHVLETFHEDPKSGHLYLFLGKRRNLVKILFWDRHGYCLFAKKLEVGRFRCLEPLSPTALPQTLLWLSTLHERLHFVEKIPDMWKGALAVGLWNLLIEPLIEGEEPTFKQSYERFLQHISL